MRICSGPLVLFSSTLAHGLYNGLYNAVDYGCVCVASYVLLCVALHRTHAMALTVLKYYYCRQNRAEIGRREVKFSGEQ